MEDERKELVSEQRSRWGHTREQPSPSGGPQQRRGNRSILVLLGVLALMSCYDQILVPNEQTDGRITVTNDEAALSERISYSETVIPIDPADSSPAGGVAAAPTPSSVVLTLRAELDPPVVDGRVVQATSVSARRRFNFLVSYNTAGDPFVGAVDYVINPFGATPRLVSSVSFSDSDVSAVGLDDDWIYGAQATGAGGLATPAALERLSLASSGILLENHDRLDITSFAATSVLSVGGVVYVTTGDGGHLYALDASDLSTLAQVALDDARWVAHDPVGGRIVVVQGMPGRISVFREGEFSGGSMVPLNAEPYPFPGADIPESKSTVEVAGGKAFIAAGSEGVQVMCLDNGEIVGEVPLPDPADLGLDPSVVVTNAVTVDEDLIFISNGEAGVYVAAGAEEFADTPCDATQDITVLGHLRFDNLESVNHVDYENKRLLVAAGLGGLKIVQIKIQS